PDVADDKIDLVGLHELLALLHAYFRPLLIVLVDNLDRQVAHLAAEVIEREFEGIAHIVADDCGRPAARADEADFHASLLGRRGPCSKEHQRRRRNEELFHGTPLWRI